MPEHHHGVLDEHTVRVSVRRLRLDRLPSVLAEDGDIPLRLLDGEADIDGGALDMGDEILGETRAGAADQGFVLAKADRLRLHGERISARIDLTAFRHHKAPDDRTSGWAWATCPNPACGYSTGRDNAAWQRIGAQPDGARLGAGFHRHAHTTPTRGQPGHLPGDPATPGSPRKPKPI